MSDDNLDRLISRRSLLRRGSCAALGLGGLLSQIHTLRMTNAALASTSGLNDYRALVCVFLFGGNDSGNTVIPLSGSANGQDHAYYASRRAGLALPASLLNNTRITPANAGGRAFALHPKLGGLADLFATGDVSVVANVGSLVQPTNKSQYQNGSVDLPPQLFSHNTQQELWQISTADADVRIGWGGRVADTLQACGANPNATVSMNLSIAGNNFFQAGNQVLPYAIRPGGAGGLNTRYIGPSGVTNPLVAEAYTDLMALQHNEDYSGRHHLRRAFADIADRSLTNSSIIEDLFALPTAIDPLPGGALGLTRQLNTVARLIEHGQAALNQTRQVFFVAIGGFDHHDGLVADADGNGPHGQRLSELNEGLTNFWTELGQLGMRDKVTTFTASDFGRTFKSNGNGSDHGWGGHHFVMGGSQLARGAAGSPTLDRGMMFGNFNDLAIDGPEDTGNGRYIPTTSVDEYAHEFARWMGVPASEMSTVFPNLNRFQNDRPPLNMLS